MSGDDDKPPPKRPKREGERQTGLALDERTRTKKPPMYKVLLHNDDYTTREFVVWVLQTVFHKNESDAIAIMSHVHNNGIGIAGVFVVVTRIRHLGVARAGAALSRIDRRARVDRRSHVRVRLRATVVGRHGRGCGIGARPAAGRARVARAAAIVVAAADEQREHDQRDARGPPHARACHRTWLTRGVGREQARPWQRLVL